MIIEMYTGDGAVTEYSSTLTKEQRKHARNQMTMHFCELLERSRHENLYWMGSMIDLVDLAHEVYMTETLIDREGHPLPFGLIARRIFAALHMPMPSNLYSMAYNARNRKGVKQTSMFSRYCLMLYDMKAQRPLNRLVERRG